MSQRIVNNEEANQEILTREQLYERFPAQAYKCLNGTTQTGFRVSETVQVSIIRQDYDRFYVTTYTRIEG